MNGTTDYDETIYYEVVPRDNLEPALWMESDRLGFPVLADIALQTERAIVKNERRERREIHPLGGADEVSFKRLFPAPHPYFGMVIGEQTDLDKLTLDEAKAFFRKYYDPRNAMLILSGDFDKVAATALVKKFFGTLKSHGQDNIPPVQKTTPITQEIVIKHQDPLLKKPVLLLRWHTPPLCSSEVLAAEILARLLTRGSQWRLDKLSFLWPGQNLFFSVRQDSHRLQSVFNIELRAKDQWPLELAKAVVTQELQTLAEKGVVETELMAVKKRFVNNWLSQLQSPLAKAHLLSHAMVCYGDPAPRTLAQVEGVRSEDLQKFVKTYLGINQRVVLYGQPESQEAQK